MKPMTILTMLILSAVTASIAAAELPSPPAHLWLVVDCRISMIEVADEMKAVGESAIKALKPGDRVSVIAAQFDRPRLRALVTLGTPEGGVAEVTRVLADTRPGPYGPGDLPAALDIPLSSLEKNPAGAEVVAVLVLTDGRMGDDEAEKLLERVVGLEKCGAAVLCTGMDTASRKLLIAATAGQLRWSRIAETDPARWLEDIRKQKQAVNWTPTAKAEISLPQDAKPAADVKSPPANSMQGKPLPASSRPETTNPPVRSPLPSAAPAPPGVPGTGKTMTGKTRPSPPVHAAPMTQPVSKHPWWVYTVAIAVLLGAVLLLLMVRDFVRSKSRKNKKPESEGDRPPAEPDLLARVDERSLNLGPLTEIRKVDIGSSPAAGVPVMGEDILPRHATLKRKGADIWLRNHARKRIVANGVPMGHRQCRRVTIPLDLALNAKDKVSLRLSQQNLVAEVAKPKEEDHA